MALSTAQLQALKTEITSDPLALGYAGKTDPETADLLNTVPATAVTGRMAERGVVDTWEILEATDSAEWTLLTSVERTRYQTIVGVGRVNLKGANVRAQLAAMFGAGTATRAALLALQNRPASRAEFLFAANVFAWDVARARII